METKLIFLFFVFWGNVAGAAKILAIFHFPCKSHHILGSALLKALAKRNHEITMVSPFPLEEGVRNYEDIEITGVLDYKEKHIVPKFVNAHNASMYEKMTFDLKNVKEVAELFLDHPQIAKLLASKRQYDLIILNWAMNDVLLAMGHHFKAPVIVFSTIGLSRLTGKLTKNPAPYSHVPNLFLNYPDEMDFFQRLSNTFWSLAFDAVDAFVNEALQKELLLKYFPEAPPLEELQRNVSLVFLNSQYSVDNPRPYVPNMVEVGGLHIEDPKPLPKKLKDFADAASDGFVFFSLGTNVKSSHLPKNKLEEIVRVFAGLKVKVLWKFEEAFEGLPKNVMVDEWLPQTDVLAHPNIKAFITHGGRLSTIEAIYFGVPIIGIPFFSDQEFNVAGSVNNGHGIGVNFATLTNLTLSAAIHDVLYDPKYRTNAKLRSSILKDQPAKPLENAVFWTEYVIRHRGAPHLQTAALKLNLWQYILLDVLIFIFVIAVLIMAGTLYAARFFFRLIKPQTTKKKAD